jgi:hypothetical protein
MKALGIKKNPIVRLYLRGFVRGSPKKDKKTLARKFDADNLMTFARTGG